MLKTLQSVPANALTKYHVQPARLKVGTNARGDVYLACPKRGYSFNSVFYDDKGFPIHQKEDELHISWLPGLKAESFPGTGRRQKALQRKLCRKLMRHDGHTSKVKEAIGDDGGANDSTRSLASPLLTPQRTKRGVDSVDSLGDDKYAEGGATAPEAKKTRRQEHVSEFEMHEWPE